jgi:hypothetical protein
MTSIFGEWKTYSIFRKIEDDLNMLRNRRQIEDNINFENGRRPQYLVKGIDINVLKLVANLNFLRGKDDLDSPSLN